MSGILGSGGCPACAGPQQAGARFCAQCGRMLGEGRDADQGSARWYRNLWFVLAMIFLVLGPFALPLVFANPRFSRRMKVGLTVVTVVYTVLLVDATIRVAGHVLQEVQRLTPDLVR